jgi:tetratricopeptide (TPR) repeat protein
VALALCLAEQGEFAEATRSADEARHLAEEGQHPADLTLAAWAVGHIAVRQGTFPPHALALLEHARRLYENTGVITYLATTNALLGYAHIRAGRLSDAITLLEQALEHATVHSMLFEQTLWLTWLGEAYLLAGRLDAAAQRAQQAAMFSDERKERGSRAWALCVLGEIAAIQNDRVDGTARKHWGESLALATKLGMRPLVARCHLGLGKFFRRTREHEQAQEHLTTATTMYREMGMTYWLEKVEAEFKDTAR